MRLEIYWWVLLAGFMCVGDALAQGEIAKPRHDPETEAALQRWHQANAAAIEQHVRELMTSQIARKQLAAALMAPAYKPQPKSGQGFGGASEESTIAFAAAKRLGPNDPLIAWMEAVDCPGARTGPGCDSKAAIERLQRIEPDNAAIWVLALRDAQEGGDATGVDRYLAQAAQARRYRYPLGEIGQLLYEEFRQVDSPSLDARIAEAIGIGGELGRTPTADDVAGVNAMSIAFAVALPALQPLLHACMGEDNRPAPAHRTSDCGAVFRHLVESDLMIAQLIGLATLARMTADVPEGAKWREQLRELYWISSEGQKALLGNMPENYLTSFWRYGEVEAYKQALTAAGRSIAPPADWLPDDPRRRAIVTTGHYPPEG